IAVARLHGQTRDLRRLHARPMYVELLVSETVRPASGALHQLGTHDIGIKTVGPSPIRHMDDAVVQFGWHHIGLPGVKCHGNVLTRSEERRVGKECRSRWSR